MKRIIIAAMLLVAISMNAQLLGEKYVGGDISMLTQYENAGKAYYDEQGKCLTDGIGFPEPYHRTLHPSPFRTIVLHSHRTCKHRNNKTQQSLCSAGQTLQPERSAR